MNKVVIITGASGGIGLAAATLFSKKGFHVYGLSRKPYESGPVHHIPTDVTDPAAVQAAVDAVIAREGRIDVLIANAGFGISGAAEFTAPEEAKKQFDVNFFGACSAAQTVIPYMRRQGCGHILFVSSVAAVIPIPFQSFYSAAKAALNAFSAALANELRPFRICVGTVMPGDIKTGFTAAREKNPKGETVYPALARSVSTMEHDEQNGMDPACIARALYRMAQRTSLRPQRTVGLKYKVFTMLAKFLPAGFTNRLVGQIYAK